MQLKEIITLISAKLHSSDREKDLAKSISGVASLDKATETEITFLTNPSWRSYLDKSKALALITAQPMVEFNGPQLIHANPYWAMAKISSHFFSYTHHHKGHSDLAFIHPEAEVSPEATVFPFAYVSPGCVISAGAVIYPQVYLGHKVRIGCNSVVFPGACLMDGTEVGEQCIIHANSVLGADGFGFAPGTDGIAKIPQVGSVTIENDVEVGALCSIDRATFDTTRIKQGSKLDSHVHVAHNVTVGENNMLCAQSGIAGSSTLGKGVILAGQAGVAPGIVLGDNVVLGARCGMIESTDEPGQYLGMPAITAKTWFRQVAATKKLPDALKRLDNLEKKINQLLAASKPDATDS